MTINAQAPAAVVMIRPHQFCPNQQTAQDNAFQSSANIEQQVVAKQAFDEFSTAVEQLQAHGVSVHMFEDQGDETPDSVFPNNWFSTHGGGHIAIYPMYAENRRKERRTDIIQWLKQHYKVQQITDYSALEYDEKYLEGTGAMVLDHIDRVAYAVRSNRCHDSVFERFCAQFHFEPVLFDAADQNDVAIYHTNVLMCVGSDFVMAGFDMITSPAQRARIIARFEQAGKRIIALSESQINQFCGNALELQGQDGQILALSKTAFEALTPAQISDLEHSVKLVPLDISTIELAGGSVRCMLAGIHLSRRQ